MAELFPRTTVGGVSVPRLIIGTNRFQGASHTTVAKDNLIRGYQTRRHYVALRLADTLTVFLDRGVDAILWVPTPELDLAVRDAEQRTGKPMIQFINPWFNLVPGRPTRSRVSCLIVAASGGLFSACPTCE